MPNLTVAMILVISMLLIIAAITKLISKYTNIPFAILLILVGFLLSHLTQHEQSFIQKFTHYPGYPDILLYFCLPTLIFEAAYSMDGRLLRQNMIPILALAVPGLFVSTIIIAMIVSLLTSMNFLTALLLGAILCTTDSVAVISIFRQVGVSKRLAILVEGESLFNSSTGFVLVKTILFTMMATAFTTQGLIFDSLYQFGWNFFGGIAVGIFTTLITGYFITLTDDETVIVQSLTIILAYLSFILAEAVFHVSGVMATITAGVMMADWGRTKISANTDKYINNMLSFLIYLVNSLIFLLVGFSTNLSVLIDSLPILMIVIVAMLVARAVMVFGLIPLISKLPNAIPINLRYQTITWWGGIQGAIGLTIVLGLGNAVPEHALLISIVMGVVLFTIIIQGSLMGKLVHWLKLDRPILADQLATIEAEITAENITLDRIPSLQNGGLFSMKIAKNMQSACKKAIAEKSQKLCQLKEHKLTHDGERKLLFLSCMADEKYLYYELFCKGYLSEQAYHLLKHTIDTELDLMRFHGKIDRDLPISFLMKIGMLCINTMKNITLLNGIANRIKIYQSITDYEEKWSAHLGYVAVLEHLDKISKTQTVSNEMLGEVRMTYLDWLTKIEKYLDEVANQFPEFVNDMQKRFAERILLYAKYESIINQAQQGSLSQTAADKITKM